MTSSARRVNDNGVAIGMGELRRWTRERLGVFPVRDDHRGYVLGA
jgi:hypothetical protein